MPALVFLEHRSRATAHTVTDKKYKGKKQGGENDSHHDTFDSAQHSVANFKQSRLRPPPVAERGMPDTVGSRRFISSPPPTALTLSSSASNRATRIAVAREEEAEK